MKRSPGSVCEDEVGDDAGIRTGDEEDVWELAIREKFEVVAACGENI